MRRAASMAGWGHSGETRSHEAAHGEKKTLVQIGGKEARLARPLKDLPWGWGAQEGQNREEKDPGCSS
jgi:hypothetical protein